VFARFLIGPGRQTALLSTRALEYDPYRQKWEKRLTRYLNWQWRIRQARGNYLDPFSVSTLLDEAVREEVDAKHPVRTKDRLEKALETLQQDGIITGWQYQGDFDEAIVGRSGWWKEWLNWRIAIEPPQKVMDRYAEKILVPLTKKPAALSAAELLAEQVKSTRKERGLTQMQAAEEIGIDQATLSRIERGRKRPAPDTLTKLKSWLDQPAP
jgi:DNA-binding XRE family transcriptional regulator